MMDPPTSQSPLSPFSLSVSGGSILDNTISPFSSSVKETQSSHHNASKLDPNEASTAPSIPSMDQISPLPLQPESPSLIPTSRIPSLSNSNLDRHNGLTGVRGLPFDTSVSTSSAPPHSNPKRSKPVMSTWKRKSSASSYYDQPSMSHQARFVTASAILSRSGAIYPIPSQSGNLQSNSSTSFLGGNWNVNWNGIGNHSHQLQGEDQSRDHDPEDTADSRGQDGSVPSSSQSKMGLRRRSSGARQNERRTSTEKKSKTQRGTSNGSALEAFSALLLHKDTKGKVSNLSFTKNDQHTAAKADEKTFGNADNLSAPNVNASKKLKRPKELNLSSSSSFSTSAYAVGSLSDWVSNDWLERVRLAGATRLGLMLPHQHQSLLGRRTEQASSLTIAERRAKKLGLETPLSGTSTQTLGFCRVGTRYGQPVYQLERPPAVNQKSRKSAESYKVKGRILIDGFAMNETGPAIEAGNPKKTATREVPPGAEEVDQHPSDLSASQNRLPPNTRLLLKRSRTDNDSDSLRASNSDFGKGSARITLDLPEAPPSPVAMPGAWSGSSNWSWSSKHGDRSSSAAQLREDHEMEGALLLPPPLLDDGSDRNSFEGLLGIKRQRDLEKRRKELERLRSRNRPDHKVGMLTAMSNFVKAAHAAEKSAKSSRLRKNNHQLSSEARPTLKERSLTEPIPPQRDSAADLDFADERDAQPESNDPIHSSRPQSEASKSINVVASSLGAHEQLGGISSSPMSRRTSTSSRDDEQPRRSNSSATISSSSTSSSEEEEELEALESLDTVSENLSSSLSSLAEFPRAPRLLPVQLSVPPSPSTPLLGAGSAGSTGSRQNSIHDYLTYRSLDDAATAPSTPRLGPTLMSLPPSPWTPHYSSSRSPASTPYHFHLNTTSVDGPPGTPKLIPTHLEILPSPFPTPSVSSKRASFSFAQPSALNMTSLTGESITSKRRSASGSSSSSSQSPKSSSRSESISPAPVILSPTQLAADAESASADLSKSLPSTPTKDTTLASHSNGRKRGKKALISTLFSSGMNSPGRLTPSSMLADMIQKDQFASSPENLSLPTAPKLGPLPPDSQVSPPSSLSTGGGKSGNQGQNGFLREPKRIGSSISHRNNSPRSTDSKAFKQRSFLIWFLVGDLWLDTRSSLNINSSKSGYLGGIAGFAFHLLNFVIFISAHLLALIHELSETLSLTFWFLRWTVLNLSGRTVLSRCLIEAHALISNEWRIVSLEDHENKGTQEKRVANGEVLTKPKGLSKFQVLRGLAELAALQTITRERYLGEGAGLIKLEGWRKQRRSKSSAKAGPRTNESDSFELEKTRLRPVDETSRRAQSSDSLDSLDSLAAGEDQDEENETSSDEDEGDIVVTNQGQDILELAKTPRIYPVNSRPAMNARNPSGYFAHNAPLDQKKKEKRGVHFGEDPTWSEDPRLLIKTIKWASRLAISAYGLHVHIVDLPPTFTPSGERFSRQTFAHLSRLNAEDVLHADIQTLDSEAAYTPTFYVVRDYARKVVVVAVRGTQSFSDIIVDLEIQTDRVDLRDIDGISSDSDEPLLCHAGILRAARALVARDSTLLDTLQSALEENEDFGICLTGHSLGGSVAAVAALLLSEYNTEGAQDGDTSKGRWLTSVSSGLPSKRPIRAITFAPPATVSAALAQRASLGIVPLVTTAVLGSDIIPRAGHGQARELRRVLGALSRVRRRHESAFPSTSTSSANDTEDDARVHIIKSWWDWRSICLAVKPDAVMLHRKDRIEEQLWKLRCDVEADLYAAVKSRHDESSNSRQSVTRRSASSSSSSSFTSHSNPRSNIPPSPWVGPQQRAKAPLHQLATRRQAIDAATLRSEAAHGVLPILFPAGRSIWISGSDLYVITSPLAFFSLPDLHPSMFAEHFPSAYESAFEDLPI